MIRLLLEPVNLLILDEPTNHLDMPSKDVLKEAIRAFDGTAIIVSHDREFLDGLVTKVFEFGGGKVREHIGGIYDWLHSRGEGVEMRGERIEVRGERKDSPTASANSKATPSPATPASASTQKNDYAAHKEQQKQIRKAERAVEESEKKIAKMEQRLKELDQLLCDPKNASDMTLVTEYTDTKRQMDEEVERWEKLSEELEAMQQT
jgi:ATP-binding cassette subfamily F protein 3